jgi:hypothetical protein
MCVCHSTWTAQRKQLPFQFEKNWRLSCYILKFNEDWTSNITLKTVKSGENTCAFILDSPKSVAIWLLRNQKLTTLVHVLWSVSVHFTGFTINCSPTGVPDTHVSVSDVIQYLPPPPPTNAAKTSSQCDWNGPSGLNLVEIRYKFIATSFWIFYSTRYKIN